MIDVVSSNYMKVFCVYDAAVGAYMQPFFMRSKGEAVRGFTEICNDSNSQFFKHPHDFVLYEIGDFDDQTGRILPKEPKSIGHAFEFVREKEI